MGAGIPFEFFLARRKYSVEDVVRIAGAFSYEELVTFCRESQIRPPGRTDKVLSAISAFATSENALSAGNTPVPKVRKLKVNNNHEKVTNEPTTVEPAVTIEKEAPPKSSTPRVPRHRRTKKS